MGTKTHWLRSVPRGKGISREAGVNQTKVRLVIHISQIVKVVIDLNRRKLSLVDNVFGGKRTNVKPFGQTNSASSVFAKHVKLALK